MALAKKCDICGEFFIPIDSDETIDHIKMGRYYPIERGVFGKFKAKESYDVCPACLKAIYELMDAIGGNADEDIKCE